MTNSTLPHQRFVYRSLKKYKLRGIYTAEDIITRIYARSDGTIDLNTLDEVHFAWFKTACLELLEELSQQYENKHKFSTAVQKLFEQQNPETRSLWASVERMLWQFRLRGTYEVRDVMSEAYAVGIRQIEEGAIIEKPLPWLRGTCFNIIRDLRRQQDKAENPKLDSEGCTPSDEAWSHLVLTEDIKVIRLALQELSLEEQALLRAKYIEDQSWQQISETLPDSEERRLSANATRQRGHRALKKLRQAYEDIREEVKLDDTDL